jgi:hypothetical protein
MMSLQQGLISTVVGAVLAYAVVVVFSRTAKIQISDVDTLLIALTVGVSILLWRKAGNMPALNDDPIPVVSPNDVLCPVVTYVSLGLLAAFRNTVAVSEWSRLRAIRTLLSLAVNVVTI